MTPTRNCPSRSTKELTPVHMAARCINRPPDSGAAPGVAPVGASGGLVMFPPSSAATNEGRFVRGCARRVTATPCPRAARQRHPRRPACTATIRPSGVDLARQRDQVQRHGAVVAVGTGADGLVDRLRRQRAACLATRVSAPGRPGAGTSSAAWNAAQRCRRSTAESRRLIRPERGPVHVDLVLPVQRLVGANQVAHVRRRGGAHPHLQVSGVGAGRSGTHRASAAPSLA